jgi:predicted MFS family arabinose efflux permease
MAPSGSSPGALCSYRFAAAETALPEFRSRAISFVLVGGLAAAFAGPMLARATVQIFDVTYLGSYVFVPVLGLVSVAWLVGLRMPQRAEEVVRVGGPVRPITQIVLQPIFIVAVLAQMMGQGVMNLLMTGTPLAMMAHHHSFADTAFVIQWHVVGMFLPGFFTGTLVQRWGERTVIVLGIALNLLAVVAATLDVGVANFWLAMTLNGIGWNFMFVAGSTLVTKAYAPAERARTQAANDFLVFGTAAVTSLSSGQLLHHRGWQVVLVTAGVMLLAALAGSFWRPRAASPTERSGLAAAD